MEEAVLVDLDPEAVAVELEEPPPKGAAPAPVADAPPGPPVAAAPAPPLVMKVVGTAAAAEEEDMTPPGCWVVGTAPLAEGAGAWRAAVERVARARMIRVLGEYILFVGVGRFDRSVL